MQVSKPTVANSQQGGKITDEPSRNGNLVTADAATGAAFRRRLLRWFDRNQRALPWRRDRHPYRVWVSEIMLQQTRVAAVLEHYARFLDRFPTVEALARAQESTVLAAWSGLGYYRRARSLHAAARLIVRDRSGEFPSRAAEWMALPGIGRYTAAAIASICQDEGCAVVDGNVKRVLARLLGEVEDPWVTAGSLLSRRRPGDFNQAMMELGATVCLPRKPICPECPVRKWCVSAAGHGAVEATSAARTARRKQESYYLLATDGNRVLLVRRGPRETQMPGMWELPPTDLARLNASDVHMVVRHSILDTDYRVHVLRATPKEIARIVDRPDARWFRLQQALTLPLTGLARKILLPRKGV